MDKALDLKVAILITQNVGTSLVVEKTGRSAGLGGMSILPSLAIPCGVGLANYIKAVAPSMRDISDEILSNLDAMSLRDQRFLARKRTLAAQLIKTGDVIIFTDSEDIWLIDTYARSMGWDKEVSPPPPKQIIEALNDAFISATELVPVIGKPIAAFLKKVLGASKSKD